MGRTEGLVLDTVGGIFGDAAAADMKRSGAYLNEVYLGANMSEPGTTSATNIVVTGTFTSIHYSLIFTPKNGWVKTTV
jgi:hypothetical protein